MQRDVIQQADGAAGSRMPKKSVVAGIMTQVDVSINHLATGPG